MVPREHDGVYWVGRYVPSARLSINAYLILDEYPTLINAGAPITTKSVIRKVESVMDFDDLAFVVLSNADISYAGGLPEILELAPHTRVVSSEQEAKRLGLYGLYLQPLIVEDGDILNIGRCDLRFVSAPFVGSADSMFVFDATDEILFSGEAFSTTVSRWQLTTDKDVTELIEAYFDTRIGDSPLARDAIRKLAGLPIKLIAPGHGPVMKAYVDKFVEALSGSATAA